MRILTPEQMKRADAFASGTLGLLTAVLMENAASAVVRAAEKQFGGLEGKSCVLFAGTGNNGGDALAAARLFANRGVRALVFLVGSPDKFAPDAEMNYRINEKIGLEQISFGPEIDPDLVCSYLNKTDMVVDGIYGTGFKPSLAGQAKIACDLINGCGAHTIAIDIPSGLDGLTGEASDGCVKADVTVTFQWPKTGCVIKDGPEMCGLLEIADIGLPDAALRDVDEPLIRLLCENEIRALLPVRKADSHKGDYGRVLIVTGSEGMTGAGCLCATGALRSGAGLVYAAVPAELSFIYAETVPELIEIPVKNWESPAILEKLAGVTSCVAGPGMDTGDEAAAILGKIVEASTVPLILDAGALTILSRHPDLLVSASCPVIVTPHPGEMSRLTGKSIEEIQKDRIGNASRFAKKTGAVVVLKGWKTIIALPSGIVYVNPTGNPGMATAGAGDVLAGVIASFAAQGLEPGDAAAAGVYIHGLAGDLVAEKKSMAGLIAGDIAAALPEVLR